MEIRRWHCYVVINCVVIIPCLFAKPFSLNKAIAEEAKQKQQVEITQKPTETAAERFSLNEALKLNRLKPKKIQTAESIISQIKKISPLIYKKTYQIKSPLKPKKLKYIQKSRLRRKNQSIKREINNNVQYTKKYIPLVKSIGMLFDNLLPADSSDSTETDRNKHRWNRNKSEETNEVVCSCSRKSDTDITETRTSKAAIAFTTALYTELSTTTENAPIETTTSTTDNTTLGDVGSIGPNTDLPLLLARDSRGSWGDDNRYSQRSGATFHRSTEGDIAWDHRNSEYNTGCGQNRSNSTNNEKDTSGFARDGSNSNGPAGGVLENGTELRTSILRNSNGESDESAENNNSFSYIRGDVIEFKRDNKLETGGDQTKSEVFVPKFIRGFRGYVSEDKDGNRSEFIQSKEDREKSDISVAHDNTSDKRITDRNGESTAEVKKTGTTNEAVITIKDLSNPILVLQKSSKTKAPMVTIIDGYSVARQT